MRTSAALTAATLTTGLLLSPGLSEAAQAAPACAAIDHRTNAGPARADENTIEGQRWDAAHNVMSEIDLIALADGTAAYHYKTWNQGTANGTGVPSSTTVAYAKTLVTKTRHQSVPTGWEMLRSIKRTGGKAVIEMHYAWSPGHVQGLVNQVRQLGLQRQVWITGTKARLAMLKPRVGPHFKVMYRVKVDKPANDALLTKYGADVVQVRGSERIQRVRYYRAHGYPVWGSGPISGFAGLKALGIRRVQSDTPLGWINYCRSRR